MVERMDGMMVCGRNGSGTACSHLSEFGWVVGIIGQSGRFVRSPIGGRLVSDDFSAGKLPCKRVARKPLKALRQVTLLRWRWQKTTAPSFGSRLV